MSSKSPEGPGCRGRWRKGEWGAWVWARSPGRERQGSPRPQRLRRPHTQTRWKSGRPARAHSLERGPRESASRLRPRLAPSLRLAEPPGGGVSRRVGTRRLGRRGWPPPASGTRPPSAVCLAGCLVGRETRGAPAEEVRVTSPAAAPGAGFRPTASQLPRAPRLGGPWTRAGRSRSRCHLGLAQSKDTDQGAYCWLVGLEAGRGLPGAPRTAG